MPKDATIEHPLPANRMEACEILRARHPRFFYENFSCGFSGGALSIKYHFRFEPDIEFAPETVIEGLDPQRFASLPAGVLESFVFHLGLVEMLSYWKAATSPEIVVRAGVLDSKQMPWWIDLLARGMGEFFYVNRILYTPGFVSITPSPAVIPRSEATRDLHFSPPLQKTEVQIPSLGRLGTGYSVRDDLAASGDVPDLVLTSGGKDSAVTLELLREAGQGFDCLLLNPTQAALDLARQAGCTAPRIARRSIDPRLLALNAKGYLNGHTPFSALLAFLGATVAVLTGAPRVLVSNERSAEEAAAEFLGREVNHQYSKSFQFETAFRSYSRTYLAPSVDYFSLLRPLYELQIARLFAQYPKYFPLFRSCNRGAATNSWCGRCPKCLFVYLALYPFVERDRMLAIFGADLFTWEGGDEVLRALLGLDRDKPFECVGTRDETLAALYLCVEKYREQGIAVPAALAAIERQVLSSRSDLPALARRVLTAWTDRHNLPPELADLLRKQLTGIAMDRGT